jgi:glycerol uptake facilitator-like aquaporin
MKFLLIQKVTYIAFMILGAMAGKVVFFSWFSATLSASSLSECKLGIDINYIAFMSSLAQSPAGRDTARLCRAPH